MTLPKALGLILILFISLFLETKFTFAAATGSPIYLNSPSELENYIACDPSECTGADTICANSQNPTNCGLPTCEGGNAWTKYKLDGCGSTLGQAQCHPLYDPNGQVYSIGDKCTSGGPYLNPGYCESAFGGPIYKTCCSDTGNALSPYQCVPFDADGAGDPEGRCPAGYQREVRCGDNGVTCGQPACGSVAPAKTCDYNRSYNQCCGNNLSQNVDEYTYSDGTGVCNWVVGACNQADASCANATPPPPTPPPPSPGCTSDGSCSATPACGQTDSGVDNCGNSCTRTGPACPVDTTPPTF